MNTEKEENLKLRRRQERLETMVDCLQEDNKVLKDSHTHLTDILNEVQNENYELRRKLKEMEKI